MKKIKIKEQTFILHPSGAMYWVEKKTLFLADVHLGKVAHFRKNGIAVPRKAEGYFYQKIESLHSEYTVERLVFLGDLFHSFQNNEWHLFSAWVGKQKYELILIEGNHDIIPAWKFEQLGIKVTEDMEDGGFYFSHFPKANNNFVFCGHLHPGIKLQGKGKLQLKLACFFQTQNQLILPAFGEFTGLHLMHPTEKDKVYVITANSVTEIKGK